MCLFGVFAVLVSCFGENILLEVYRRVLLLMTFRFFSDKVVD